MNEIIVNVKFAKGRVYRKGISLKTNDYNSTKIKFEFDREDGTKIFELKNPNGETIFVDEIVDNEIILARFDENEVAYPLFTEAGEYVFEISLYKNNSKLTSASSFLIVEQEKVIVDGEIVETYTPMFDNLLSDLAGALEETENLDIDVSKTGTVATVTITNKDGVEKSVSINDGAKGDKGDKGDTGNTGPQGIQGPKGDTGSQGPKGETGEKGAKGDKGDTGSQGPKGDDGDDYVITQSDYQSIANVVESDIAPTISSIQDTANTAKSIAEGANQAVGYSNYQTMITDFNSLDDDVYRMGQNIYIVTVDVPDLWISEISSTSSTYTYVDDATFISALETNGYVQVGYYKLSMLETQKVDLTNYVTNTDYATSSVAGVIKIGSSYASTTNVNGYLYPTTKTYSEYDSGGNSMFISKGTLENVLAGKGLNNIVTLSQADYNALTNKDANTYYYIVEE